MPCSHNGLLFVSHISCWRRKRRPFKSRSSTLQKKPASKGSWFPPFENGSAAEAEFAPRHRPLFVPRRRLLKKADFLRSRLFRFRMVPEARVELARLSTTVFETAASAIPPLGREIELYPMFPKAQTEISEHAQKSNDTGRKSLGQARKPKQGDFGPKTPKRDDHSVRRHRKRRQFCSQGLMRRSIRSESNRLETR